MVSQPDGESLEQQRDLFTFFIAICFTCLITAMAHGYFALSQHEAMGPSMAIFRTVCLYLLPGLVSGYVWLKWGLLIGPIIGAGVRVLSLINLGFVLPYVSGESTFSFEAAVDAVAPFSLHIGLSLAAGLLTAGIGWLLGTAGPRRNTVYRWADKAGIALLFLGFILAGGAWIYSFLPLKDTRGLEGKMQYAADIARTVHVPVTILIWAGLAVTAAVFIVGLGSLVFARSGRSEEMETTT